MTSSTPPEPHFAGVTLGMISWKAPRTLAATIKTYEDAGILELWGGRIIHFNEISQDDRAIATRSGFAVSGSDRNIGIFNSVDAIAAKVTTPYLLFLENDCVLEASRDGFIAMMTSALADMGAHDIPIFSMRSRYHPGESFARRERYEKRFRVIWPIGSAAGQRRPPTGIARRLYEDRRRSSLRGSAIYAEQDPTLRHPSIIRRTDHGNWMTSAPYLSWSNNSVLVSTPFLRDVVLDHVRRFPARTTLNGHQDIEASMKQDRWWGRQSFPIGQSEPGPFTHLRLDR